MIKMADAGNVCKQCRLFVYCIRLEVKAKVYRTKCRGKPKLHTVLRKIYQIMPRTILGFGLEVVINCRCFL